MEMPEKWKTFDAWNREQIQVNNVAISSQDSLQSQNVSLVFRISHAESKHIYQELFELIPNELHEKIIFQPHEGYHVTIQWTPDQLTQALTQQLISELKNVEASFPKSGTVYFPALGRNAVLGILDDETTMQVERMRSVYSDVCNRLNIATGLPPHFYSAGYVSLGRFSTTLTEKDLKLFECVEFKHHMPISFESILLGNIDKFLTPTHSDIMWESPVIL